MQGFSDAVLHESEVAVTTKSTTLEKLIPPACPTSPKEELATESQASTSADDSTTEVLGPNAFKSSGGHGTSHPVVKV